MKFPDIPGPPGQTPREKFMELVRHVISVPKEELDKQEEAYKRQRRRTKKHQKTQSQNIDRRAAR